MRVRSLFNPDVKALWLCRRSIRSDMGRVQVIGSDAPVVVHAQI